jgi:hypothetical protein
MKTIIPIFLFLFSFQWVSGQTKTTKSPAKPPVKKIQPAVKKPVSAKPKPVEMMPQKAEPTIKKPEFPIINQNNETKAQTEQKTQTNIIPSVEKKTNTTSQPSNVIVSKSPKDKKRKANENLFEIGLQGGLNSSTLTTNPLRTNNKVNLIGWNAGIIFSIPLSKRISLQPEINYANHGIKYAYDSDYEKLTMKYVEMPLLFKYNIINGGKGKIYLQAGGYGGYWLSAELENSTNQEVIKEQYPFDDDISDGFKDNRFNYGLLVGIGASIKLGSGHIFIQSRYQHGLSDIAKFSTTTEEYTPSLHRVVSATIGYSINF